MPTGIPFEDAAAVCDGAILAKTGNVVLTLSRSGWLVAESLTHQRKESR